MTNNKICVLGANEYINQVPRVKEGLKNWKDLVHLSK